MGRPRRARSKSRWNATPVRGLQISTIDLQAGYWQVTVRKQDQDKTAFMPFGLRNAPDTFQRFMDRFRAGLSDLSLFAYLDDLVLFSATKQEHLVQLERIFQPIRHFKLRMKREKCFFGCPEVRYLGHRISARGIVPDPDKVQAIASMPPPANLKHAHTFLRTCSWFGRFIPNFANISKPLSDLLKKNAVWEWAPTQQETFETLKNRLITAPSCSKLICLSQSKGALGFREEQMSDPEVRQVIDDLTTANSEIAQPWTAKGYVINQGVLYHYPQEGDDEEAQLVVPVHERPRILKEFHAAPTAGHYGVARTLHKISSRYYSPGMRIYVMDYLKTCLECQRYKQSNVKPAGTSNSGFAAKNGSIIRRSIQTVTAVRRW
jgi:hypothetical protein